MSQDEIIVELSTSIQAQKSDPEFYTTEFTIVSAVVYLVVNLSDRMKIYYFKFFVWSQK